MSTLQKKKKNDYRLKKYKTKTIKINKEVLNYAVKSSSSPLSKQAHENCS